MKRFTDIRRQLIRTVAPTVLPVSCSEVKAELRLGDVSDWDSMISHLWIPEAVDGVETDTMRALLPQTWQLTMDEFPYCDPIQLRRCPVNEVESVEYLDDAGDLQTLDESEYDVDVAGEPGIIRPRNVWPQTGCFPNAVKVTFTAGWQTAAAVPPVAKQLVKLLVSDRFTGCDNTETYRALLGRLQWSGMVHA